MRSDSSTPSICEDTDVKVICAVEAAAEEYKDCPVACRANSEEPAEDVVVKSGDLAVTATAAAGKSVIIGGVNDLDTLTFKTSEEVELTKVVLERYGYSTSDDVVEVRLEDEDGNKIADERTLTKDKVTLSVKKDYRSIDGTLNATVVVKTRALPYTDQNDPEYDTYKDSKNGSSLGFKVVDVTSTAKNVDLGGYGANLYDIVSYVAGTLTLNPRAASKSYNYEADESYEIAKFKATNNGTNAIAVNGFTLHQYGTMSAEDFVENVTVTANGEKVSGLKASFNKDDELVVSFNEVEVAAKKNVTFAVNAELGNEFDEYTKNIAYAIQDSDDVNAVEKKTGARVEVDPYVGSIYSLSYNTNDKKWEYLTGQGETEQDWSWPVYTFNGGKIKLTNTKLGNIDASAGATDVVIAEGTLSITEAIKGTFTLTADNDGIDSLTMVVAGEEFDSKKSGRNFTFTNVEIEKGGKVQFKADIENDDNLKGNVINFGTFKLSAATELKYVESKENAKGETAGSITFSKVTIQAAKASLENDLTKEVEFIKDEGSRKVVFDGTYTAKKADVYLNEFEVTASGAPYANTNVTLYLFVNGEEVADTTLNDSQTFSNVLVKGGEKAKIKVEAELDSSDLDETGREYTIILKGEDSDNLQIKDASAPTVTIKVVNKGSVIVDAAASKSTVLLKAANASVAKFTIKPENASNDDLYLEDLTITVTNGADSDQPVLAKDIRIKIDGVEEDGNDYPDFSTGKAYSSGDIVMYNGAKYVANDDLNAGDWDDSNWDIDDTITLDLNEELGSGIEVEVVLKNKAAADGVVTVTVEEVNGKGVGTKVFKKRFAPVLVTLHTEDLKGSTKVVLGVEKENSSDVVSNVKITIDGMDPVVLSASEVTNGDDFEVAPATDKSTHMITAIEYCVNIANCATTSTGYIKIEKTGTNGYNDYFRDGSSYAKIFNVD